MINPIGNFAAASRAFVEPMVLQDAQQERRERLGQLVKENVDSDYLKILFTHSTQPELDEMKQLTGAAYLSKFETFIRAHAKIFADEAEASRQGRSNIKYMEDTGAGVINTAISQGDQRALGTRVYHFVTQMGAFLNKSPAELQKLVEKEYGAFAYKKDGYGRMIKDENQNLKLVYLP